MQSKKGKWYFHVSQSRSGSFVYREKRFAGVDISIGDSNNESTGGLLIRSIYCNETKQVYCGPGQVMEYIVQKSNCETVSEMVEKYFPNEESLEFNKENSFMQLCEEVSTNCRVFPSPRVGLFLTKKNISIESQIDYMVREYRFCIKPKKLWKGKHYLVYSLICRNESPKKISDVIGVPLEDVKTLIDSYNNGKKTDISSYSLRRLPEETQVLACFGAIFTLNQK